MTWVLHSNYDNDIDSVISYRLTQALCNRAKHPPELPFTEECFKRKSIMAVQWSIVLVHYDGKLLMSLHDLAIKVLIQ